MYKQGEKVIVPLSQGHYGGPADTVGNLLLGSKIPLGFFYGEDVMIDECGYIRARPELLFHEGDGAGSWVSTKTAYGGSPVCVFKNQSVYYSIISGGSIQRYTGGAWGAMTDGGEGSGHTYTYTGECHVEYIAATPNETALAILSSGEGSNRMVYIGATGTGDARSAGLSTQTGLTGQDEDRLFCWGNDPGGGKYIFYSIRGDYSAGYDWDTSIETPAWGSGEWFLLGPSCYEVIGMMNVAGALHIIKQSADGANMLIWRKVQIVTDEEELIDQTWFSSPLGANNTAIMNGYDGLCAIGGNILAWAKGQGLAVLINGGMELNCEAIRAGRNTNLDYSCVLAPCDNHRVVLVKPEGLSVSYVYDYMNKRWYKWNVDVTCKGFGEPGGMFGVSGTKSPAKLGDYPTDNNDATIIPILYTSGMNLGYPEREKFLTKLFLEHRDITEVKIYWRIDPDDAWALQETIATPGRIVYLDGTCRGGEFYLKITGSPMMIIKNIGIEFDVGGLIQE